MDFNKNMRAGYQGTKDSMRELADRLTNNQGMVDNVYETKSSANKSRMKPYMKGGAVKKEGYMKGGAVKKFAVGGVAKIRHGEATADGTPKGGKKKSLKDIL